MTRRWLETARHLLDTALYAIVSGLVFLWLWH
jgi:hypothetical protein